MFVASTVMEITTTTRQARLALAHTIAVIWLACELSYRAGFAVG